MSKIKDTFGKVTNRAVEATGNKITIYIFWGLVVFILFNLIFMAINCYIPGLRDPETHISDFILEIKNQRNVNNVKNIKGVLFAQTHIKLLKDELDFGWLPNDKIWPTRWLDNRPEFQLGVLEAVRFFTQVFRDNITRMRTTDILDPNIEQVFTLLNNDARKWIWPRTEGKYRKAILQFEKYTDRLIRGEAKFYPRSDNFIQLMDRCMSLLGGVNQQLLNSTITEIVNFETAGDVTIVPDDSRKKFTVRTSWLKIDDHFYYTVGVAYAMYYLMLAIREDFSAVIADKNAGPIIDEIINKLKWANFSPLLVMRGGLTSKPKSMVANHMLKLSAIINDARQKMSSLTSMLDQG